MPGTQLRTLFASNVSPLLAERCSHLQHVVAFMSATRDLDARSCSHVSSFGAGWLWQLSAGDSAAGHGRNTAAFA